MLLINLFSLSAVAASPAYLMGLQIKPSSTHSQFTFILTKKIQGQVKSFTHPDRVIVELNQTVKQFQLEQTKLRSANVTAIRAEETPQGSVRVIFTTKGSLSWTIRFLPSQGIYGIPLQLILTSAPITKVTQKLPQKSVQLAAQKLLQNLSVFQPIIPSNFMIVIDPGHGGKDTGAIGQNGTEEKTVVLAIAKRMAAKINKTMTMRAVLTREGDYFVPLRSRLKLARQNHADLFIAIHADAYFDQRAKGASVYALSPRGATSEAARWLAQRDNYSELGGIELSILKDRSPMLRSVLIDLAQTVTIQDSIHLGNKLLDALKKVTPLHYPYVEQARFVVLKSPDIPSILVETGFISHPEEENRLSNPAYQKKIVDAMVGGVKEYLKK